MLEDYTINKIYKDEYGRISGIFIVDKPIGITSHDLVYVFRRKFKTPKVGHAGALDPFATGIVIILVGKCLKLSEKFLELSKEYEADILFGVSTNTQDPEGEILKQIDELDFINLRKSVIKNNIEAILNKLKPQYSQYVPAFSSVKVNGQKLRILAREYPKFNIVLRDNIKYIQFLNLLNIVKKELPLPFKKISIYNYKVINVDIFENFLKTNFNFLKNSKIDLSNYPITKLKLEVSKGTYIRQLAVDVGELMYKPIPSMLIGLRRTKVFNITLENTFDVNSDLNTS